MLMPFENVVFRTDSEMWVMVIAMVEKLQVYQ